MYSFQDGGKLISLKYIILHHSSHFLICKDTWFKYTFLYVILRALNNANKVHQTITKMHIMLWKCTVDMYIKMQTQTQGRSQVEPRGVTCPTEIFFVHILSLGFLKELQIRHFWIFFLFFLGPYIISNQIYQYIPWIFRVSWTLALRFPLHSFSFKVWPLWIQFLAPPLSGYNTLSSM